MVCLSDPEEVKAMLKEYTEGPKSKKKEFEKRYGRKKMQELLDLSLSESWISNNSKKCPKCQSPIEVKFPRHSGFRAGKSMF